MNVNKIKLKIKELESNLENKTVQVVLQNKTFELDKLKKSLKDYDKYIEQISDEDLIKTIEIKINELVSYSNQSSFENYSHQFINAANFLISNTPKEQKNQENNTVEIIQISEEEFSKRYDKLIESLNFEGEECNLILETPSERKPFNVFKNKNNSLAIYAKSSEKPMTIAADRLLEVAFNKKAPTYTSYETVIISKIMDNSIFDFLTNESLPKDLIEAMKTKLLKNEDELLKLSSKLVEIEKNNQELSTIKESLSETLEQSTTAQLKFENATNAAVDYAKLNASVSHWQTKQNNHKTKFLWFGGVAIGLIGVLIWTLFWASNFHENQNNKDVKNLSAGIEAKIIKVSNQLQEKSLNATKQVQSEIEKTILPNKKEKSFDFDYSKLVWYVLMIFASSSVFWIIRITVKIALSNLHLSEDAHERVVMIQTYLSFVKEGQIDENDKNLILSSLFRPSNIGIIKDESSVTVADIITAFKK